MNNRKNTLVAGLFAGLIASLLLVMMARKVIDHVLLYDELLHILSARELIASGKLAILDGLYERAEVFTRVVGFAFQHYGTSPVIARLPALVSAIALLFLMAVWITRRAGFVCGVATVLVLAIMPATIELAVFARFYTFHALVIAAMGVMVYEAASPNRTMAFRCVSLLVVLLLTALGLHLQETTVIALGALMAGFMAVLVLDRWTFVRRFVNDHPVQIVIAATVLIAGGVAAAYFLGLAERFGEVPLWARHSAHRPQYYLFGLSDSMPLLWPMFPFLLLASWFANRRLTLFCLTTFALTFVVHSIAAQKSLRYIYYVLPFMATILGSGIAGVVAYAGRSMTLAVTGEKRLRRAALLLVTITLVLSLEGQRALKIATGKMPASIALSYAVEADWSPAISILMPWVRSSQRLVTSNAMKSVFYLGGYDYELNASIVAETDSTLEFGKDERTGRQAVGSVDSVRKILTMPGQTLIVLEQETMGLASGVSSEAVALIKQRCAPIALPASAALSAWSCLYSAAG